MAYNSNKTGRNKDNDTRTTLHITQAEPIVGDNTYKSPGTYVVEVDPDLTENVDYSLGSAVYTGIDDIQIELVATISTKSTTANVDITMTGGVNGVPDLDYEVEHKLTVANDVKELTTPSVHKWTTGDTLDFFVKATADITLEKAIWIIRRYDG